MQGKFSTIDEALQAASAAGGDYRLSLEASSRNVRKIPDRTPRIGIRTQPRTVAPVQAIAAPSQYPTVPLSGTTESEALRADLTSYETVTGPTQQTVPGSSTCDHDHGHPDAAEAITPHPAQTSLPPGARPPRSRQPGWQGTPDLPTDICYKCFGLGHRRASCPVQSPVPGDRDAEVRFIIILTHNWSKLKPEHQHVLLHKGISPYHGAIRVTPPGLMSGIRPSAAVIETE